MSQDTCVYLHTRLDGIVFYVGIGVPNRPYSEKNRNKHWHNTTRNYAYTVTILHENLTWEQACALEIELIKKYRELSGAKLCNITTGGEGIKGMTHSPATRARLSVKARARPPISAETRAKISVANKGNKSNTGKTASEETRAKMREAHKTRPLLSEEARKKISYAKKGKSLSEEHRAKLSESLKGKTHSEETRAKMSASHKNLSLESRAKMSESQKARQSKARNQLQKPKEYENE